MPGSEVFTVVGSRGFIGRKLVGALETAGHRVQALDRVPASSDRSLGHVVFAAGVTADFRRRPLDTMEAHVGALIDLLRGADFESLLYLSSTRVYEGLAEGRENAGLLIDPADPLQLYNASKLAGEALCLALPNPAVRVVRLSNVVGAADRSETFLSALLQEAAAGVIRLRSAPESAKDFIHIDDVLRVLPALRHGRHRLYNLAAGRNVAYGDIVRLFGRLSGAATEFIEGASIVTFPPIDITRVQQEFGFVPTPFEAALERVWTDFRSSRE